ncbi:hypothetical protein NQ317_006739 [Molorchus minor]|uniref:Uncharacterized protein n=1 Tax=Molorchus minor TaxID=1323400 RepID=A0ABQ9ISK2_9CUCU|nr:hypothetical protein NQ317_006739 [Molorchus minor]
MYDLLTNFHFVFGFPCFFSVTGEKILDPFEMGDFGTAATPQDIENAIGLLDKRILEMKFEIELLKKSRFTLLAFRAHLVQNMKPIVPTVIPHIKSFTGMVELKVRMDGRAKFSIYKSLMGLIINYGRRRIQGKLKNGKLQMLVYANYIKLYGV